MSSPKPKTWAVALMAVISVYFVYVMSLGIGKFDNCHTGAEDEHLRWRKDFLSHLLTVAIVVPATLFAQKTFDAATGNYKSSFPMFIIGLSLICGIGAFFAYEIITENTDKEGVSEQCVVNSNNKMMSIGGMVGSAILLGVGIYAVVKKSDMRPYQSISSAAQSHGPT